MVESNQRSIVVEKDITSVYKTIQENIGEFWDLLFKNFSEEQAELVYLCGMYSGSGTSAFIQQKAKRSLVFIKLFRRDKNTEVIAVTGGSVSIWGLDIGRYERIINEVLAPFEGNTDKMNEWPKI